MTIVMASHPVPVRYVPRGGSLERLRFEARITPVELREAHPSDVELAHPNLFGVRFFAHEGRLWTRPAVMHRPASPDQVVRWLKGEEIPTPEVPRNQLLASLSHSPFMAKDGEGHIRGASPETPVAGRVTVDGTERCARAVQSFLDANVRICGDTVLVRAMGPVVKCHDGSAALQCFPQATQMDGVAVTMGRAEELWRFHKRPGGSLDRVATEWQLPSELDGFPTHLLGDEDIELHANLAMARAFRLAERISHGTTYAQERERARNMAARLAPQAMDGMLRMISPAEAETALEMSHAAFTAMATMYAVEELNSRPWKRHVSYQGLLDDRDFIEAHALPRLRAAPEMSEDDFEAISAIRI